MSSRPPLAELRARARAAQDTRSARRLLRELCGDPREGAGSIAQGLERRIEKQTRDRRRVSRLFELRRELFAAGHERVAGVDEVGVGPLAGPVVAAAVILGDRTDLAGLNDSKQVPRLARERLDGEIRERALAISIAEVWPDEIDRLNIYHATLLAMRRCVLGLAPAPDHILVDARTVPGVSTRQTPIVGGDARDGSIAAASIVAKVHRDALMRELARRHPDYGFDRHMGYGTAEHLEALRKRGPSSVHRRSFAPCAPLPLV